MSKILEPERAVERKSLNANQNDFEFHKLKQKKKWIYILFILCFCFHHTVDYIRCYAYNSL